MRKRAAREEKKLWLVPQVIIYSMTVGVLVCFGVAHGFLKAMLGGKMKWYMIKKTGNETGGITVPNTV